jgi:hypothetical protein
LIFCLPISFNTKQLLQTKQNQQINQSFWAPIVNSVPQFLSRWSTGPCGSASRVYSIYFIFWCIAASFQAFSSYLLLPRCRKTWLFLLSIFQLVYVLFN